MNAIAVAITTVAAVASSALALAGTAAAAAPLLGPLTPAALHAAYSLPTTARTRQTVAIIVAYDDPTLEHDLGTFSRRFSLPACTSKNGCLRRVNERGIATPLPPPDLTGGNWITEAALSAETLHGICQNCRLLVVEADTESKADLAAAVNTAVRLGAREIATTYVFGEGLLDDQYAAAYNHPGVVITASTGDGGFSYNDNVPAAYPGVVAVGGTDLRLGPHNRRAGETVWNNSDGATASGCSEFTEVPPWQVPYAAKVGCGSARAVADVAAAAAPGAPVYSSTPVDPQGDRGWFEADGTSLSSPIVAGVFALAGGIGRGQSADAVLYASLRKHRGVFHDITRGSNGSCRGRPICTAAPGYDGPTGVGSPNGLAGF